VVVTSPVDGGALQTLAPSAAVRVVPNGVDVEYFRPAVGPSEAATLVLSGKMSYHANVTAALYFVHDILPTVRHSRPDTQVRIVGSKPPGAIRKLGEDPAISVTGYVDDLRQAIGGATIAVCPTKVKAGIQNKVLEAMAMGIPVVSTTEGVEGLSAAPGRDVLVADSPQEFADQVCHLLASPALRERIGAAGRQYVETHHRWDAAARRLEGIYGEAMESRATSQGLSNAGSKG
jgi:glycosyltransferase involved in cell wall biosynthesis